MILDAILLASSPAGCDWKSLRNLCCLESGRIDSSIPYVLLMTRLTYCITIYGLIAHFS